MRVSTSPSGISGNTSSSCLHIGGSARVQPSNSNILPFAFNSNVAQVTFIVELKNRDLVICEATK